MTPEEYQALVKRMAPRSPILRDTALAFLVGGAICVVGQLLSHWYGTLGLDDSDAGTAASVTLVFLSALATGLGLYHKLARWAGAGTLVPITGFANAVASPAVDFQTEGLITFLRITSSGSDRKIPLPSDLPILPVPSNPGIFTDASPKL